MKFNSIHCLHWSEVEQEKINIVKIKLVKKWQQMAKKNQILKWLQCFGLRLLNLFIFSLFMSFRLRFGWPMQSIQRTNHCKQVNKTLQNLLYSNFSICKTLFSENLFPCTVLIFWHAWSSSLTKNIKLFMIYLFQVFSLLPIYLLQLCDGMNSGFPAILTPQLREDCSEFDISPDEESWIGKSTYFIISEPNEECVRDLDRAKHDDHFRVTFGHS